MFTTYDALKEACILWCVDRSQAMERYGSISDWVLESREIGHLDYLFQREDPNDPNRVIMYGQRFNDDISRWDVSWIRSMVSTFKGCEAFNGNLNKWDVSKVQKMPYLFHGCTSFNQDLSDWDVSQVTDMSLMFAGCSSFNQNLSKWNVTKVRAMTAMFDECSVYNQPMGSWDVSNVQMMAFLFNQCAAFNQPLNGWNVANVVHMTAMFSDCVSFNQPLPDWNVTKVTGFSFMFQHARSFNQPLHRWKLGNVLYVHMQINILKGTDSLSPTHYERILTHWFSSSHGFKKKKIDREEQQTFGLGDEPYFCLEKVMGKPILDTTVNIPNSSLFDPKHCVSLDLVQRWQRSVKNVQQLGALIAQRGLYRQKQFPLSLLRILVCDWFGLPYSSYLEDRFLTGFRKGRIPKRKTSENGVCLKGVVVPEKRKKSTKKKGKGKGIAATSLNGEASQCVIQ